MRGRHFFLCAPFRPRFFIPFDLGAFFLAVLFFYYYFLFFYFFFYRVLPAFTEFRPDLNESHKRISSSARKASLFCLPYRKKKRTNEALSLCVHCFDSLRRFFFVFFFNGRRPPGHCLRHATTSVRRRNGRRCTFFFFFFFFFVFLFIIHRKSGLFLLLFFFFGPL